MTATKKDSIPRKSSNTEEIQRKREAEHLLNHPMVTNALDAIEGQYLRRWMNSPIEDVKVREYCFRMFRTVQDFRLSLTKHIEDGNLAESIEDQERSQRASLED